MKNIECLKKCPLFAGIEESSLPVLLACLEGRENTYQKGETVFAEGARASFLGIVLSGRVQIVRLDYHGNRTILTTVSPGHIFGESFACASLSTLPVSVIADQETTLLLLGAAKIAQPCQNACSFHSRLTRNLLRIVATKNLIFHQKLEILSKRTTREKLLTYLSMQAKSVGKRTVRIPYDRQGLADYLGVERSGLSAEIGKLRKEGVLQSVKNTFTLTQAYPEEER